MDVKGWFDRALSGERRAPAARQRGTSRELVPVARNEASLAELGQFETWGDLLNHPRVGRTVSPDEAMRHSAVYGCVRLIAGTISMLPLHSYFRQGEDRQRLASRMATLLRNRPNPRMSAVMFWRAIVSQMLLRGNGYAYAQRSLDGDVLALWPVRTGSMSVKIGNSGALLGRLVYSFQLDDGTNITADQDDVLHFPGTMEWDGLQAKSPIRAYSDAVAVGLAANDYGRRFFENDATPQGYIRYPDTAKLSKEQMDTIREYWLTMNGGENRHMPAVLSSGGEWKQTGISAEDAQLLETRGFQVIDVARIFGVPPHMIGAVDKSTSWGSGIEEQTQAFITYTLGAHLAAIEQEVNYKIHRLGNQFSEFERRALVQALLKERNEAWRIALGGSSGPGYMTQNEVRRAENLPALAGGDQLVAWPGAGASTATNSSNGDPEQ